MAAAVPAGRTLVEKALAINPKFDVTGAAEARALLASTSDRTDAATQQSRRVRPNAP